MIKTSEDEDNLQSAGKVCPCGSEMLIVSVVDSGEEVARICHALYASGHHLKALYDAKQREESRK